MRKTKIIGFSIPPETYSKFESVLKIRHKTKSEFFREILDIYFDGAKLGGKKEPVPESDLAHLLRKYWEYRSAAEANVIVAGLGIIAKDGKVLIGQRKIKDQWVENLTWVFPGGKMQTLHFNDELKESIKKETGLDVEIKSLVASRIHPDSGFKNVQIVALYFYCAPRLGQKEFPGGGLKKLKWVKPTDVFKYFTTSVADEVTRFLMTIERDHSER